MYNWKYKKPIDDILYQVGRSSTRSCIGA